MHKKSITFLYGRNEQLETEIENTMQFAITPRKIKHLGIKLIKCAHDLYIETIKC